MKRPPGAPEPDEAEPIARSRRAASQDAVLSSVMTGLTDPFMIPYVLALGATPAQAGLLASVRNALLAVVQLGSARAVELAGSRRRLVLATAAVQAVLWVPLGIAGPVFGPYAVAAVIALYTVGTAVSALGGPAWGSLLADYIEPGERGAYFGRRARLAGVSTSVAGLVAGGVLQLTARGTVGFSLLCFGAGISRAFSWRALFAFHDRGWRDDPHLRFGFARFLARTPRSNFARFSLCLALSSFAAHVAAPYFAVYLLDEADYSYASYTLVILGGSVTGTLCSPWWGALSDRVGNHAVMRWTLAGVTVLPALWLVSTHPLWMVAANVLGAFLWGGLNLSAANFVYDAVSAPKRHTCIAYFNVLNGLGVSAGALAGGQLFDALAPIHPAPYVVVFYASVALRMVALLTFQNAVREVRPVRPVGLREVVLDLVGQRLVGLLGFLSVRPEAEFPGRDVPQEDAEDVNAAEESVAAAHATDPSRR